MLGCLTPHACPSHTCHYSTHREPVLLDVQVTQPWVTTVDDKDFVRAGGLWTPEVVVTMRMVRTTRSRNIQRSCRHTHCLVATSSVVRWGRGS